MQYFRFPLSVMIIPFFFWSCSTDTPAKSTSPIINTMYFPPLNGNSWETQSFNSLGWNEKAVTPLLDFLKNQNTKGFMILVNGRIVMENYFNGHDADALWYWASAGKTLTTAITGIAQQEKLLNIDTKVSQYLGNGWTSAPLVKEHLITCKHLLTMTSGLDDSSDDVSPAALQYKADAGTRWAYHNVFVKLQDVVAQASGQPFNNYFNSRLRDKIGMDGSWFTTGFNRVYSSTTRSMARFGLLMLNKGKWENTTIVNENFITEATTTSQNINLAYGYLWWLNGKTSYHLPQTQLEFQGSMIPNAPTDVIMALGKNDQKIYLIPSKKMVIIRMGDAPDANNPAIAFSGFDQALWQKILPLFS